MDANKLLEAFDAYGEACRSTFALLIAGQVVPRFVVGNLTTEALKEEILEVYDRIHRPLSEVP